MNDTSGESVGCKIGGVIEEGEENPERCGQESMASGNHATVAGHHVGFRAFCLSSPSQCPLLSGVENVLIEFRRQGDQR